MGMEQEQLIPGMQDRGAANTGCAVTCIGGDGAQVSVAGAEQEVEHDGAVPMRRLGRSRARRVKTIWK